MPVRKPATMNRTVEDAANGEDNGQHVCSDIVLRTKIWLDADREFAIGEGGLDLLRAIVRWNSLSKAAREVGWSYRHAWGYLRHAENALGIRLTSSIPGKGGSRGTKLTDAGCALVESLSAARQYVRDAAAQFSEFKMAWVAGH